MRFPEVVWARRRVFTDFDELGIAPNGKYVYYAAERVPERGEWFLGVDPFLGPIVASPAPMDPPPGREVAPGEVLAASEGAATPGGSPGIPIPFEIRVERRPFRTEGKVVVGDLELAFSVPCSPAPRLKIETEGGVVRGYREVLGKKIPLDVDELSDLVRHYTAVAVMVSDRGEEALGEAIRLYRGSRGSSPPPG